MMTRRRVVIAAGLAAVAVPAGLWAGRDLIWPGDESGPSGSPLLDAARRQKGVTLFYDAGYSRLAYPGGDVPRVRGACTDVIIRAARDAFGRDLQRLIHEDMAKDFPAYPHRWNLAAPDANIDHRRVPNLETYCRRQGAELWSGRGDGFPAPLRPGDIITFLSAENWPHIAIVAKAAGSKVRIVHNIGLGVREETLSADLAREAHGHYRWPMG